MSGNEELFGLEQSRGWTKLMEVAKIEHDKRRSNADTAIKSEQVGLSNYHLGWVDCIKWVSKLPSQMMQSLPKEK